MKRLLILALCAGNVSGAIGCNEAKKPLPNHATGTNPSSDVPTPPKLPPPPSK